MPPKLLGPVTLDTPLAGRWPGTPEELSSKIHGLPKHNPLALAKMYMPLAETFILRADILWAMMRIETADLTFPGQVKAEQNNLCGLRKADGSGFYSFPHLIDGVIAHVAHVAWHVFPDHVSHYCSQRYDPKHSDTHPDDIRTVSDLSIWAGGSKTYPLGIARAANE